MMSTTGFCRGEVQWGRGVMSVHQGRRSRWQTDDLQDACCTCAEIMPASDRLYLVKRESCFRFALAFCSIVRTKSRRDIFQKMSIAEAARCQHSGRAVVTPKHLAGKVAGLGHEAGDPCAMRVMK